MRSLFLFLCLIAFIKFSYCQSSQKESKPAIDTSVFGRWPTVGSPSISADGNYVSFIILKGRESCLVLKSLRSKWEKVFEGASKGDFTQDSKHIIIKTRGDSLLIWKLGSGLEIFIPNVTAYIYSGNGKDDWLTYRTKGDKQQLKIRHLNTGEEDVYSSAKEFLFSDNRNALLVKTESESNDLMREKLFYINLVKHSKKEVWEGKDSGNFTFDISGTKLAFTVKKTEADNEIWYYNEGSEVAVLRANNQTPGVDSNLFIANRSLKFSSNGSKIFFSLQEKDFRKADPGTVQVDIWHYSEQLHSSQPTGPLYYLAVINNNQSEVIRLQREDEAIIGQPDANNDFVLFRDKATLLGEKFWNEAAKFSIYLMSTTNNSQIKVLEKTINFHFFFSPDSKYLIYYDFGQKAYFSFDIEKQVLKNITSNILFPLNNEGYNDFGMSLQHPVGIGGWINMDGKLFPIIYDDYDLWIADPEGIKAPINFTNGYGRSNNIKFRLVYEKDSWNKNKEIIYSKADPILLTAFNTLTKDNGFYSASLKTNGNPALLTMGPFDYYHIQSQSPNIQTLGRQMQPLKALNKNVWIVRKGSSAQSPNYFVTHNFKSFTPISSVYPERSYNWLTTELHQWKTSDGKLLQGILYKPENFDSTKKYPLLFYYYEKQSDGLNLYVKPGATDGPMNIPYFVSNDYIVFEPDIHYTIGEPGESALRSVTSAAKHLSKYSWIDTTKMGLQGHSFGGYETNYLITHTSLFAAAAEANGHTDLISGYGSLQGGASAQWHFEIKQFRLDCPLWQKPDLYIKNSPILNVPSVATPLLMMHNKGDEIVPWSQAVEFFNALHRLGKKVWMLQYDDGDHGLNGKSALDYTIRLTQFFDHFLKGKPAPKWILSGVPARLKGIETGF